MTAALSVTTRLTTSLREIAAALASPNETALLTAEPLLAQVVDELRTLTAIEPEARLALLTELQHARAELERCRTLGANAVELIDRMLALHGGQYDHLGLAVSTPTPARGRMQARL